MKFKPRLARAARSAIYAAECARHAALRTREAWELAKGEAADHPEDPVFAAIVARLDELQKRGWKAYCESPGYALRELAHLLGVQGRGR